MNPPISNSGVVFSIVQIAPILALWGFAALILIGDTFAWKKNQNMNVVMSLFGVLIAAYYTFTNHALLGDVTQTAFAEGIRVDYLAFCGNLALLVTAALSILLASSYLKNRNLEHGEYYGLVLLSVSGGMIMVAANELIVLFLGLEVLSFALYILAGFARTEAKSEEASVKYFLLGAFASAFLLYGIALIYGATQTTNLDKLLVAVSKIDPSVSPMLLAGVALVLIGLGFKAAVIPFHQWTPDVYEGAPTSVTAFMASVAKIAAFIAIMRVFSALMPIHLVWAKAFQLIAIFTMIVGNLLAVTQTNLKRLLAYSSIAHAGYLLVAVVALSHSTDPKNGNLINELATNGAVFYLFAYTFMTLGAFGVLVYLSNKGKDYQQLNDLKGLARKRPLAAYSMMFFMLSLGGIPPTMGFIGKWQIFTAAIQAHEINLSIWMGVASAIAIYYYLKVVYLMIFEEPVEEPTPAPTNVGGARTALVVSTAAVVLFGVVPNLLTYILNLSDH